MTPGMPHTLKSTLRLAGAACLLIGLVSATPSPRNATTEMPPDQNSAAARFTREVRLRKLHLVRPDLIPYPIAYDVYC